MPEPGEAVEVEVEDRLADEVDLAVERGDQAAVKAAAA